MFLKGNKTIKVITKMQRKIEYGLLGEFYFYQIDENKVLLVDPSEEAAINFEIAKNKSPLISTSVFRGKKTVILKESEIIEPVQINSDEGYFEGLYYYYRNKTKN